MDIKAGTIHPTAVIDPRAKLDPSVSVGPYSVIDGDVELGANCVVGPQVYLTGHLHCGSRNRFHAGCVMGDAPQDLKYKDEPTRLVVGDHNVFREQVTVHRSAKLSEDTVIGSHNLLMVNSHVGHNCVLGNHVILANGVLLGGHVTVGDRAFLSGNCLVHQFVRVGTVALMQGGSAISRDLPPFTIARGGNGVCGLNVIGLRRAGFSAADRLNLKQIYHILLRKQAPMKELLVEAEAAVTTEAAKQFVEFVASAKKGVCLSRGSRYGEAIDDAEE